MNANLKSKLLLNLAKNKKDQGFTLIELLVVIIIIGVLSAVALPNLLSQVGKARESEAKNGVSTVNRTQQAYFTERTEFAPLGGSGTTALQNINNELGAGLDLEFYQPDAQSVGQILFLNAARANDNTRDHGGAIAYDSATDVRAFSSVICRMVPGQSANAIANTDITGEGATGTGSVVACATTNVEEIN